MIAFRVCYALHLQCTTLCPKYFNPTHFVLVFLLYGICEDMAEVRPCAETCDLSCSIKRTTMACSYPIVRNW